MPFRQLAWSCVFVVRFRTSPALGYGAILKEALSRTGSERL
jgi:hypothetical protein